MDFLNEAEVIEQYRQSVMNSENIDSFGSVVQKFQRLKTMTMVILYENNPIPLYDMW